jgi:hypothetical protein
MTKKLKTYMGHPIIHQNRRVVIMEVKDDDSFSLGHQLVLWDKQTDLPVGWADKLEDGSYCGFALYGPHELRFDGETLSELASEGLYQFKWSMKH